jgi:AcrR family transcriptional regulator
MNDEARGGGRQPVMPEDDRRQLILRAAEQVFCASGYGAATMEEIARACGMAKKTLYKLFPDKMAVFVALIDSHDNPHFAWEARAEAELHGRQALRTMLMELARFVLSPRQISLTRLVISEAHNTPELARRFYDDCIVKNRVIVAAQIARNPILPRPPGLDPVAVVDTFVGGTLGILQLKALMLDMDPDAIQRELEERVDATVAVLTTAAGA